MFHSTKMEMTTVYSFCSHQVLSELSARNTCMACFPMLTTSNKVTASTTSPFCSWLTLLLPVEFLLMFSHCSRTFRFSLCNKYTKHVRKHNTKQTFTDTSLFCSYCNHFPRLLSFMPQGPQQFLTKHDRTKRRWKRGLPIWILLLTMSHNHRKV